MDLQRWTPPPLNGISAQRIVLRGHVPADGVEYMAAAAGDSPFSAGEPLTPGTLLPRPVPAWFRPELGPEPTYLLALDVPVLAETPDILAVDKPHGLPSTPNGALMRATAQTLLRVRRNEPELVAAHRLDRLTGGVLIFSRRHHTRSYLQTQFQRHEVRKVYVAEVRDVGVPHLRSGEAHLRLMEVPRLHDSRESPAGSELISREEFGALASGKRTKICLPMKKIKGDPQVRVEPGGKATVTWVTRIGERKFRLEPLTGHTHQLRVLMNFLGMPIIGDDTYPIYQPGDVWNPDAKKLQLRSVQLELKEPNGHLVRFEAPGLEGTL